MIEKYILRIFQIPKIAGYLFLERLDGTERKLETDEMFVYRETRSLSMRPI